MRNWTFWARWILCVILASSAGPKLVHSANFERILRGTGFFDDVLLPWLALGIPIVELGVAMCLALQMLMTVVTPVVLAMGIAFSMIHGYALLNGTVSFECGCLAPIVSAGRSHWFMSGVSLCMIALSVVLFMALPLKGGGATGVRAGALGARLEKADGG